MTASYRRWIAVGASLAAILVTVVATSGVSAAPSEAHAGKTITIAQQEPYSIFPVFMAQHLGYLKKDGITDVKYTTFQSLPALFASVAQGQVDLGFQVTNALVAYNKATSGSKMLIVAPGELGSLLWATKNGSGLPSATASDWQDAVKAWKGKKIGVPAPGGILDLMTRYMLKQVGLDPVKDVTITAVGAGPSGVAALQSGAVDVITGDPFSSAELQAQGIGHAILNFALRQGPKELTSTLAGCYFTSQTNIDANKPVLAGFASAVAKADAWMADPKHKAETIKEMVRTLTVPVSVAQLLYMQNAVFTKAALNQKTMGATVTGFVAAGIIPAPAPAYGDLVAKLK